MDIVPTGLPDVKLLRPRRHRDPRGWFAESWNRRQLARLGIKADFLQDNLVQSQAAGVLRGLHYQRPPGAQGKLIAVLRGAIFDVALDIRHGSATYGRHVAVRLDADAGEQLWIPPGFAHGYCTLVPECLILYKVTAYYDPKLEAGIQPSMSTQMGFGKVLDDLAKTGGPLADRIVTTSPDVTVSTNLGPWVNRRGLFAREAMADTFKSEQLPSTFNWEFSPKGQHMELGIAEANLFILLSALGLSHTINGVRLLPVGTLYDPFIARGLDQLNYACYQDARFMVVATPSGITLAPEGGAHQSVSEPLIGLAQDGLAAFEPAYVDELAVIMRWAFDYMQKSGGEVSERNWLRDETGGSVYLRLSTRPVEQIQRKMTSDLAQQVVDGAYWLRKPGPNAQVVVAYTGAIAPEAIEAVGLMAEDRRDVGLLAVTSADRLNAGWTAAQRARERGLVHARSHIERLLADVPPHCGIVSVLDGHPATLAWLGAVAGHRTRALGVEHFGQTGALAELYRHYGIDGNAIVAAAQAIAPGRPIRHLKALP